jgi:death-on-curing protein
VTAPPQEVPRSAALAMQGAIASEHGGSARLRSPGALESALATVGELVAFGEQDALELAAALANAILRDPPFAYGNLPVALALAGVFLERNGWRLVAPEAEAAAAIRALATQELDRAAFAAWLRGAGVRVVRPKA